jgi:plastocyanin
MKSAGSFDYYCRFHPNMTGRIVVTRRKAPG